MAKVRDVPQLVLVKGFFLKEMREILTRFIKCDRINSTIKSMTEQASDLDWPFKVEVSVALIFLCLIGARCNFTANTKFGSCIKALAYWSSVTHNNIKKLNFTVLMEDSDLVSCITIEQYSRKVTRRLLGVPEIISSIVVLPLWDPPGVVGVWSSSLEVDGGLSIVFKVSSVW